MQTIPAFENFLQKNPQILFEEFEYYLLKNSDVKHLSGIPMKSH
jgi:hypothetical protein